MTSSSAAAPGTPGNGRLCLVLGGGGFLGSHLTPALLEREFRVRVLDRPGSDKVHDPDPRVEWMEGDFLHKEQLGTSLQGCDILFHLACTTHPRTSNEDPAYDVQSNVVGTLELLTAALARGIKKVIFVSSGGTVYGVPRSLPIPESHPTDPVCSYGIMKLAIEKYLELYYRLHGLDYCVLRVSNLYGEGQGVRSGQGAVAVFLDKAIRGEEIEVWGDGSVVRDYVYVGDVVGALIRAIDFSGEPRTFNIGSGRGTSIREVLQGVAAVTGTEPAVRYLPSRAFDVPSNVLDVSLAASVLGWRAATPFEEGLKRTYGWMAVGARTPSGSATC